LILCYFDANKLMMMMMMMMSLLPALTHSTSWCRLVTRVS